MNFKKSFQRLLTLLFSCMIMCLFSSCKNYNTREDIAEMPDKTVYLLPIHSSRQVDINLSGREQIWQGTLNAVIKGYQNMDVKKFASALEKRYGIKVDTAYFEKGRSNDAVGKAYFEFLSENKACYGLMAPKYCDSDFYKEIEKIRETKSCIEITIWTQVTSRATTSLFIHLWVKHPKGNGFKSFSKIFKHGTASNFAGGFFSTGLIDYNLITNSLVNICDYNYDGYYLDGRVFKDDNEKK